MEGGGKVLLLFAASLNADVAAARRQPPVPAAQADHVPSPPDLVSISKASSGASNCTHGPNNPPGGPCPPNAP
uniref:Uncharacterized protein n=1 Tax=Leersia perrieri TaxID=77586 RepID=A0A0D9XDG7_9ORYZ